MPLAVERKQLLEVALAPHKKWSRTECRDLAERGIIDSGRYELLAGEIVEKVGKNKPHVIVLMILAELLRRTFGWERVVTEAPIDVAPGDMERNEPEPDLVVLKESFFGSHQNPTPADIDLVVEVSGATRALDLGYKAALYAAAGIAEYWVADLDRRSLIVHRQPENGKFTSVAVHAGEQPVTSLAAPEQSLFIAAEVFSRL